jgi:hypothetical protein
MQSDINNASFEHTVNLKKKLAIELSPTTLDSQNVGYDMSASNKDIITIPVNALVSFSRSFSTSGSIFYPFGWMGF